MELVFKWREAVAAQIGTPSPFLEAVQWKRIASRDKFLPMTREEIDGVIAEDLARLEAHPSRRPKPTRVKNPV